MSQLPRGRLQALAAAAIAAVAAARAQDLRPQIHGNILAAGFADEFGGDYYQQFAGGTFVCRWPELKLEIRGGSVLALFDRGAAMGHLAELGAGGLPRRGGAMPAAMRRMDLATMRSRVASMLAAAGQQPELVERAELDLGLEVLRYLYCEGDVSVTRDGVEILRASRLWISPIDNRIVAEDVTLRLLSEGKQGRQMFTVRGPRLERTAGRWVGRNLSFTGCSAGEPHFAIASGEIEIIEREREFEVRTRGNRMLLGGASVLPLPDASFFTASQGGIPLRSARVGYSSTEGGNVELIWGSNWNGIGGGLHEWLTGRPAREFRGEWTLGTAWNEERGFPLDGRLTYGAAGVYRGSIDGFMLQDEGTNQREILTEIDGSPIDNESRHLARTENRFELGEGTHLDLQAFSSSDPAVYSEFFGGDYRNAELPETSLYLHSRADNRLFTLTGRWNLDDYAYADNRALATDFVEELPVGRFHWLGEEVLRTPWDTPVLLDAVTDIGQRRRKPDRLIGGDDQRTTRVSQGIELSAPVHLGPLALRPFVNTTVSWYDDNVNGNSDDQITVAAGARLGTRMSRTWRWLDDAGNEQGMRHVIAPEIDFENRFVATDPASDFHQFDELDAAGTDNRLRFAIRNLLQRMGKDGNPRDFLFVDLAQNVFPNAGRDNGGDHAGLFEYDLLVRPDSFLPLPDVGFGFEGEHDWEDGMRTMNAELSWRMLGVQWATWYRADEVVDGSIGLGASAGVLDRWRLSGSSQYDLDTEEFATYTVTLDRLDHDWTIRTRVNYDPYADELSLHIEFTPRFGSSGRRLRDPLYDSMSYGGRSALDY